MAQKVDINTYGNQTLQATLENIPLTMVFQWDGRNDRYMIELTNNNTDVIIAPQSMEPFSALDIQTLGLGDFYLIPVMNNPVYLATGEIEYEFEDLGTNLILGLFTEAETLELSVYAPITLL